MRANHERQDIVEDRTSLDVVDRLEEPLADHHPNPVVFGLEGSSARYTLVSPYLEIGYQLLNTFGMICTTDTHYVKVMGLDAAFPDKHL